jgi:hypothetical protein
MLLGREPAHHLQRGKLHVLRRIVVFSVTARGASEMRERGTVVAGISEWAAGG